MLITFAFCFGWLFADAVGWLGLVWFFPLVVVDCILFCFIGCWLFMVLGFCYYFPVCCVWCLRWLLWFVLGGVLDLLILLCWLRFISFAAWFVLWSMFGWFLMCLFVALWCCFVLALFVFAACLCLILYVLLLGCLVGFMILFCFAYWFASFVGLCTVILRLIYFLLFFVLFFGVSCMFCWVRWCWLMLLVCIRLVLFIICVVWLLLCCSVVCCLISLLSWLLLLFVCCFINSVVIASH